MSGIVKTVNFNDGEGLDPTDLNNAQRFQQAYINDCLLRHRMRVQEHFDPSFIATKCFMLGSGGGIAGTGTALRSTNTAGVICTLPDSSNVNGNDPRALSYYLADGELLTNHAAAHATQDRWDLIAVKLEQLDDAAVSRDFEDATTREPTSQTMSVSRSVLLTKQVVQGANAAAGTAVEPAIPAGFVRYAAVFIPATFASTFVAETHLRDWRVPIGSYSSILTTPNLFYNESFSLPGTLGIAWSAFSSGQKIRYLCPIVSPEARILNLSICAKLGAGAAIDLVRINVASAVSAYSETVIRAFGDTGDVDSIVDLVGLAGPVGADSLQGPLWCNGYQNPQASFTTTHRTLVGIRITASGTGAQVVAWVKAEIGLA